MRHAYNRNDGARKTLRYEDLRHVTSRYFYFELSGIPAPENLEPRGNRCAHITFTMYKCTFLNNRCKSVMTFDVARACMSWPTMVAGSSWLRLVGLDCHFRGPLSGWAA
jgi:hypothetical protein